jgi:hypothetical protein
MAPEPENAAAHYLNSCPGARIWMSLGGAFGYISKPSLPLSEGSR